MASSRCESGYQLEKSGYRLMPSGMVIRRLPGVDCSQFHSTPSYLPKLVPRITASGVSDQIGYCDGPIPS